MFVPDSMRGNRRDRKRKADDKDDTDATTTDTTATTTTTTTGSGEEQKQGDATTTETTNPPPKKTRKQRKAEKHARWKLKDAAKKKEQDASGWFIHKQQQQQQKEGWVGSEQKNAKFEEYYQAQNLIPPSEWSQFMDALRRVLPITFRVSSINGVDKQILSELTGNCFGVKGKFMECGEKKNIQPPSELPWYPDHMGWYIGVSKSEIKRIPELKAFRQFLIGESLQGNITRQEAVSMIPPLLLDVQPHHYVLDMCAAPGSKTAQLLEALHREGPMAPAPTGMVIANDADPRRAYMLVHQLKRLGSAHYLITTHDGQHFPNMFRHVEEKSQEPGATTITREIPVEFDRILCDVPCSGDGTLRKNINVWTSWTPQIAIGLHPLQVLIAMRGIALLKVDGLMVYSTCSFNPIENEAVVAELLRRSQGALELVDCSDRLPGLIRYPGITTWRVQDKGVWLENYEACPESRRKAVRKSMFPPTPEEVEKFHLERCLRVFPHSQDTGGFFISLLRKTRHFKRTTPATTATTTTTTATTTATATSTDSKPADVPPTATATATVTEAEAAAVDEIKVAEDEDLDEEALAAAAAAAAAVDAGDEETAAAVPAGEGQGDAKPKGGRGKGGRKGGKEKKTESTFNEDPFQPMDAKIHAQIQEYYGFTEELNLFARSSANKRLYYIAPAIAQCLVSTHNQRLKVVHSGNKAIEHCSTRDSSYPLEYRIVQEGVYSIAHLLTKQVCYPEYSDFIHLLTTTLIKTTDLTTREDEFAKQVKACKNGSLVCIHRSKEQEAVSTRPICLCVWKTPAGLNLMIPKEERNSLLSLFTKQQAYTEHALRPAPTATATEQKQTETVSLTTTEPSQQPKSAESGSGTSSSSSSSAPDVEMS